MHAIFGASHRHSSRQRVHLCPPPPLWQEGQKCPLSRERGSLAFARREHDRARIDAASVDLEGAVGPGQGDFIGGVVGGEDHGSADGVEVGHAIFEGGVGGVGAAIGYAGGL